MWQIDFKYNLKEATITNRATTWNKIPWVLSNMNIVIYIANVRRAGHKYQIPWILSKHVI